MHRMVMSLGGWNWRLCSDDIRQDGVRRVSVQCLRGGRVRDRHRSECFHSDVWVGLRAVQMTRLGILSAQGRADAADGVPWRASPMEPAVMPGMAAPCKMTRWHQRHTLQLEVWREGAVPCRRPASLGRDPDSCWIMRGDWRASIGNRRRYVRRCIPASPSRWQWATGLAPGRNAPPCAAILSLALEPQPVRAPGEDAGAPNERGRLAAWGIIAGSRRDPWHVSLPPIRGFHADPATARPVRWCAASRPHPCCRRRGLRSPADPFSPMQQAKSQDMHHFTGWMPAHRQYLVCRKRLGASTLIPWVRIAPWSSRVEASRSRPPWWCSSTLAEPTVRALLIAL